MNGPLLDLQLGASPANNNPMQWAVLAFGVVTILYLVVIRPMRKGRSRQDPLEQKPTRSSLAQQRAIERDMGNLLVQYEEMIRRMTAQVDIRATKLEMLIQDAERKIAELKALEDAAKRGERSGSTGSPQAGSPGSPQASSGPSRDGDVEAKPAASGEAGAIAPAGAATLQSSPADSPAAQEGEGTATLVSRGEDAAGFAGKVDDRHADIYRLADGGRTARQIAQELNRPDGEVELILHLRNPRPRQGDLWEQPAAAAPADPMPGQAEAFNPPDSPPGSGDARRKGRKRQRSSG